MKYLLHTLLFLLAFTAKAQDKSYTKINNMAPVQQQLIKASGSLNTITSDFIQHKHLDYLSVVIESKGKFWFSKPATLRWEYTDPFKYLILINNGKITIKDDEKKNEFDVNSNKVFQELNDLIVNSVNGTLIESNKYDFEMWENKEYWLVKLVPKNPEIKKVLNHMELYFLKTDKSVNQIKMVEADNDYTLITLTNRKFNNPIQPSVFQTK